MEGRGCSLPLARVDLVDWTGHGGGEREKVLVSPSERLRDFLSFLPRGALLETASKDLRVLTKRWVGMEPPCTGAAGAAEAALQGKAVAALAPAGVCPGCL